MALATPPSVPAVGEGRTWHLYLPFVAKRIRESLPDAKLLALLRDPVERVHSHWWHRYSRGQETLGFADAVAADRARIERGGTVPAYDYIDMAQQRARLVRAMDTRLSSLDVLALPTCPIVAPRLDEVATPDGFARNNMLLLRNTSVVNFFDLCAISLPLRAIGGLSAGLMLVARNGADRHLLNIAAAVERLTARQ